MAIYMGAGGVGAPGKEIQLQTTATHLQWRYVGESWQDLVLLSELGGGGGGGTGQLDVAVHSNSAASVSLTNQPNSEQYLGNSPRNTLRVDAAGYTQCRIYAWILTSSASANDPRFYPQYSLDGSTSWVTIGSGADGERVSLAAPTGVKTTDWINLPEGAKADVYFRVAQNGGDSTADPAYGRVHVQFK